VLALTGLALIGGVLLAQVLFNRSLSNDGSTTGDTSKTTIADIRLAALADPTRINESNPPLRQFSSYTTNDYIALKITTTADAPARQEITARLLTSDGGVKALNPPSFVFPSGTSTFCCWQVDTPGTYTLQLFRPEGGVTTFPLTIKKGVGGGNSPQFDLL